jgi:hypothetical protein
MRLSLWGYLIALALGGASQFVREPAWLSSTLLFIAFVIALLAMTFMRDGNWLGTIAFLQSLRSSRNVAEPRPSEDRSRSAAAARAKVPRPAGPAGPVPVLQKRPQVVGGDTTDQATTTRPQPKNPSGN